MAVRTKRKKIVIVNIDEIFPKLDEVELEGEELIKFAKSRFDKFYSEYIHLREEKSKFFSLPLEFFTKENVARIKSYADLTFGSIIEEIEAGSKRYDLPNALEYYQSLQSKVNARLVENRRRYFRVLKEKKKKESEVSV